jgi:protein-L-isoaspartate(D-aspartate) O-methyltransferase
MNIETCVRTVIMKDAHKQMLKEIEREAAWTASYTGRDKFDRRVMDAMAEVSREKFVPAYYLPNAYDNGPLPIDCDQTISQPYIVALMTDLLDLSSDSIVLEVGTGSGYQAAILSRLAKKVYTIERIEKLAQSATRRLKELNCDNVETRCSDGYAGWEQKSPFDGIIVTATASQVPPALIAQLKPGGRMVIPVGREYGRQELVLVTKQEDGTTDTRSILDVRFVPLVTE